MASLVALLTLYAIARVLQLYAGRIPTLLIVVLHVIPPAIFALVHGSITYRLCGTLVFSTLCLGVGTFFEGLSLRTGFPFGHYYFTDVMGPKLFQLPILLALAYFGMGYLSWTVARILLGLESRLPRGRAILFLPLTASFVMVAWDLAMDPVWAYIDRAWVWRDGGPYFGVPLSNYAGWFLTVLTFYLGFAFYLRRQNGPATSLELKRSHWLLAILFYATSATGNLLQSSPEAIITDHSGRPWRTSEIIANCYVVSILAMGAFVVIACARLFDGSLSRKA